MLTLQAQPKQKPQRRRERDAWPHFRDTTTMRTYKPSATFTLLLKMKLTHGSNCSNSSISFCSDKNTVNSIWTHEVRQHFTFMQSGEGFCSFPLFLLADLFFCMFYCLFLRDLRDCEKVSSNLHLNRWTKDNCKKKMTEESTHISQHLGECTVLLLSNEDFAVKSCLCEFWQNK